MGIMPTEAELALEQSQQGLSYEVSAETGSMHNLSASLERSLFHFSRRSTRFYRLSHSEIGDIEKVAVRSNLRLPNNKCALIESRAIESNQKSH
ncbi:hypothetical protein Tco_0103260 [Tanacetum coccineum]